MQMCCHFLFCLFDAGLLFAASHFVAFFVGSLQLQHSQSVNVQTWTCFDQQPWWNHSEQPSQAIISSFITGKLQTLQISILSIPGSCRWMFPVGERGNVVSCPSSKQRSKCCRISFVCRKCYWDHLHWLNHKAKAIENTPQSTVPVCTCADGTSTLSIFFSLISRIALRQRTSIDLVRLLYKLS